MIRHLILILSFLVNFIHCYEPKEYMRYAKEISNEFAEELQNQYNNIKCIGGGGKMPHDIEEIDIRFVSNQSISIEEARKIEVAAVKLLLKKINGHEQIRPFLRNYPFGIDRINVMISFQNNKGEWFRDGSVALIYIAQNKIFYHAAELQKITYPATPNCIDPNNITYFPAREKIEDVLIPLHEEPYEEAVKIVKGKTENKK